MRLASASMFTRVRPFGSIARNFNQNSRRCPATQTDRSATAGGSAVAASVIADPWIGPRKQQVGDERADDRQRAQQQDEAAREIHVLGHQRAEQHRARGGKASKTEVMISPDTSAGRIQPSVEISGSSVTRTG